MALFCVDSGRLLTSQGSSSLAFFCAIRQTICCYWFAGAGHSQVAAIHPQAVRVQPGVPGSLQEAGGQSILDSATDHTLMNSEGSFPSGKTAPSSFIWMKKPRTVLKLVRNGKPYLSPFWFTSPAQQIAI
ncbi:hypothetical protein INR49_030817 [Caranx melampygus]|nr:hypothetical protein INR49_030817 [Caranx melampygus]